MLLKGDALINISDKLRNKLNMLPMNPGIYKMIDSKGNIIYVGKSKMLRRRVKTYFSSNSKWDKVNRMVSLIDDIDFIVTDTHLEARILECSLIKTIKPIFNSQMKHDRGYVYLKVENYNKYRALSVVEIREENTFGPFRRRFQLNETIKALKNLYPIKRTDKSYAFDYHLFPVTLNEDEFNENRSSLYEILTVKQKSSMFIKELTNKMKIEASLNNFEIASIYKEIIDSTNYIIKSINKNNELLNSNLIVSIPLVEGYKLFYISNGIILKKEIYNNPLPNDIESFKEMALLYLDEEFMKMDEKSLVDFKDIVCSEIIFSSEIIVTKIGDRI